MDKNEIVLITGGSGLVGSHLRKDLEDQGFTVRILSRSKQGENSFYWNPGKKEIDHEVFGQLDHIIHLAGAGIADGRWTEKRKQTIIDSRVETGEFLAECLEYNRREMHLKSIVCASAVGYYGNRGEELLNETSEKGSDFMAEVCEKWEQSSKRLQHYAETFNIVRIGIVLSKDGGVLPKMLMTKKVGVLNYFGNGQQYYSWIHIEDVVRIFIFLMQHPTGQIVYNAVANQPLTNKAFIKTIADLGNQLVLPAPEIALKLAMGEMSAVVLNSNRVSNEAIEAEGYQFEYPKLKLALKTLL